MGNILVFKPEFQWPMAVVNVHKTLWKGSWSWDFFSQVRVNNPVCEQGMPNLMYECSKSVLYIYRRTVQKMLPFVKCITNISQLKQIVFANQSQTISSHQEHQVSQYDVRYSTRNLQDQSRQGLRAFCAYVNSSIVKAKSKDSWNHNEKIKMFVTGYVRI